MTLITLLIVLMLEQYLKVSAVLENEFKSHKWFPAWRQWLSTKVDINKVNDWVALALIIGTPVAVLYILSGLDYGFIFWVVQLVLAVVVMIYCLGPIDQNAHLKQYFEAVERDDLQGAYHHVSDYLDLKSNHQVPDDISSLGRLVTRVILSQSNFRYFGVLMYFVLLGPAGALLYRLAGSFEFSVRDDENSAYQEKLRQLRMVLDWLPARLTGFLYSLAGDFTGAMPRLKQYLFTEQSDNERLLEETGLGALGIKEEHCTDIIDENKQALDLVTRTVVVFLVIIAVLTVFGWLS
ncbi:MAG: AmpE protein [Enterobacterales bacterium]|jgi:AmpE protein